VSQFSNHTKEAEKFNIFKEFDPKAFNFNKTSEHENVLTIRHFKESENEELNSIIKVNISPIFISHLVFIPRAL
jgi:hypothetical protein